jgi:hypothetical protein
MLNRYRHLHIAFVRLGNVKAGGSRESPSVGFYPTRSVLGIDWVQAINLPHVETVPGAACCRRIELSRYKAAPLQALCSATRPYTPLRLPLASRLQPDYFHFTHDLRIPRIW